MTLLQGKRVLLGVSGGIAAYKSCELLREIQRAGGEVRVVMTHAATKFVAPLTFEALSRHPVYLDVVNEGEPGVIRHIDWAEWADYVVIAPATANIIGKLANGIADDALSTLMMAVRCPVLVCPAMNTNMYESRAVQRNIDRLEEDGFHILEPGTGEMACGTTGAGRLPEPPVIRDRLMALTQKKDFRQKKVLLTAGPTSEAIDPVRYISNHSSGKMGYAIACAAEYRGADVTLVSGPVSIPAPLGVDLVSVKSAREMMDAVMEKMAEADVIIKVAAVADYRVANVADHKIKKTAGMPTLELEKNPDILETLGKKKTNQFLVGFAAETRDLETYAKDKIARKNLDMIVGNLVGDPKSGFGTESNTVTFFYPDGASEPLEAMTKFDVANVLLDRIREKMESKAGWQV